MLRSVVGEIGARPGFPQRDQRGRCRTPFCFKVSLPASCLGGTLTAGWAGSCLAQTGERPFIYNVPQPGTARTRRLRVPNDFFRQEAVHFARALIDTSGMIRADGHNLNPESLWGCSGPSQQDLHIGRGRTLVRGQRAFVALRNLLDGQPITCSFMHASVPPKAICLVRDKDVTEFLLGEGWAELADGWRTTPMSTHRRLRRSENQVFGAMVRHEGQVRSAGYPWGRARGGNQVKHGGTDSRRASLGQIGPSRLM